MHQGFSSYTKARLLEIGMTKGTDGIKTAPKSQR